LLLHPDANNLPEYNRTDVVVVPNIKCMVSYK